MCIRDRLYCIAKLILVPAIEYGPIPEMQSASTLAVPSGCKINVYNVGSDGVMIVPLVDWIACNCQTMPIGLDEAVGADSAGAAGIAAVGVDTMVAVTGIVVVCVEGVVAVSGWVPVTG